MIANLPLLFANGNPTTLAEISVEELEKFITFMVTCSWGHDTVKDIRQPLWWPEEVPFSHPFQRPQEIPANWENNLKNLVRKCYDYHKSAFLLIFSAQLSRYPKKRLRYVDNTDYTTSLYYLPTGKLLVTFRNENLIYDRKDFLRATRSPTLELIDPDSPAESIGKSTDIYLCDYCDSHFDNLNLLRSHERLCNDNQLPPSGSNVQLSDFLKALKLKTLDENGGSTSNSVVEVRSRQVRSTANLDRGAPFPFSSLAYKRNVKNNAHRENTYSRERVERYCCGTSFGSKTAHGIKNKNCQFPVRYRRPIDYWHRKHIFPNQRKKEIIDLKGQLYLLKCRPMKVHVQRMSLESIKNYIEKQKKEAMVKRAAIEKDIEFVAGYDCEQIIQSETKKAKDPLISENEVIDLCSDDESSETNENCDPRAGVACVMRGGAVLRRTADTPRALPDQPCGARQRSIVWQSAILQPNPIILISQSQCNIQTIAID